MRRLTFILFFLLVTFGLVMLASASVVDAQKTCGSSTCMLMHQITFGLVPGLLLFFICAKITYETWRKLALPLLLVVVVMLILVFVSGIGLQIKGAQRWIDLGIATIQPSEFLKLGLIVYLAAWFGNRKEKRTHSLTGLIPFFLVLGLITLLLILQPDFGTLGIIILISVGMYFFSGAQFKHFAILIGVFLVLLGGLSIAEPYRFERIKTFLNPHEDIQGSDYHIRQAMIGIGSGGIFGLGYGQSRQKNSLLPEPEGDSIFSIIVEELGLLGAIIFIATLIAFLFGLLHIAKNADDVFARMFVLGVAVWIGGQAFINMAAISGVIPLTGVPLPLVSYGSSSFVSLMIAMGITRNIAKTSD